MVTGITFLAILIIVGIIIGVALLVDYFNDKIRAYRLEFENKIQTLTDRLTKLETKIQEILKASGGKPQEIKLFLSKLTSPVSSQTDKVEEESSESAAIETSDEKEQTAIKAESPAYFQRGYSQPSRFEQIISMLTQTVVNYFKTGNTVVKIGVIVLFFGVSFLVKFASDKGFLPIEIRLIAAAIGGIALTQFGWRLRLKKPDYALVTQGGGVGILFITTFAALQLYQLIPAALAFPILVGLAGFTSWMAIVQNSKSLAAFAIVGGFLAPVLASTDQGNHVILFSYYALLNCGIVTIAWFKAWRILNLLGFVFTYVISMAWGILQYQSHHFWTVEPFLVLFFLIYVTVPILFAKRQKPKLRDYVDGTLVFGNTLIAFGLQTQLVQSFEYATAFSALCVSLFYLALGKWLYSKEDNNFRVLVEAFVGLGIVFATIAIPLAFDGQWTAAVWAAEAAGIYWMSVRQGRILGRIFSSVLIFAAGIAFMMSHQRTDFSLPILNSFYFGCLIIAMGSLVASFVGFTYKDKLSENEKGLIPVFFIFGSLWWIIGGYVEIEKHLVAWWSYSNPSAWTLDAFPIKYVKNISMAYVSVGFLACSVIGRRLKWHYLNQLSFVLVGFLGLTLLRITPENIHPFAYGGFLAWPLAFGIYYYILRNNENLSHLYKGLFRWGHASALWLLALVGSWELGWQVDRFVSGGETWKMAANGLVPIAIIATVLFHSDKIKWPLRKFADDYLLEGAGPILIISWMWVFFTNWDSSGDASPLMYLPILNPLETVQAFFMVVFPFWIFKVKKNYSIENHHIGIALGLTYFFWLNGILMRGIHHFAGVPFNFSSLFASPLVQTALSIYWSIIGISLMIFASKRIYRWLWISGASMMGIVVVKLFLIDLSKTGTVERIISFISVGLILLLVGYFSPIPPKKSDERSLKS